jgi:hypothetical protein
MRARSRYFKTALLGFVWLLAIAFGVRALLSYENTPGRVGSVPNRWPVDSGIERATDRPTLVMLVHPQCPCTRASVAELAKLMARVREKVRAYVLVSKPRDRSAEWIDTAVWKAAKAIPDVSVLVDVDGEESRRFGAETSGHTIVFNSTGRLIFVGGITGSRGHEGDNIGENAIVSLLGDQNAAVPRSASIFGCSFGNRQRKANPCPN